MSSTYKYKVLIGGVKKLDDIPFLQNSEFEKHDFFHIGISIKPIECMTNNGDSYLFIFWSLNKEERFEFMASSFCYGARGALLCLDRSDSKSLEDVVYWIETIKSLMKKIPIIILIYQSNFKQNEVNEKEIDELLNRNDINDYFTISSGQFINKKEKRDFYKFLILKLNYELVNNITDFSLIFPTEEKEFKKFTEIYSTCPICKNKNHIHTLKEFYFSKEPDLLKLRENFIEIQKKTQKLLNLYQNNIKFGILCCSCYKKYYKKKRSF